MKYLRYTGQFVSVAGTVWRVDIMQEADGEFSTVGALAFDADTPLALEWQREDKENVICGSTGTLKIISPGDRTYEDLYSIEVGRIRMDVYKDSALYWSGTLDPEFYEEPYEQLNGYVVQLTFSDFGVLDRVKYDLMGMRTLREIVNYAVQRSAINSLGLNTDYVSTTLEDGKTITGGALSVRSENFIDEDGEASTMKEVIEGILQPLALRMIQREGYIYLYDLNGLYGKAEPLPVEWDGDSQTMGVDKVANNVKITFSPYSSSTLMDDDAVQYTAKYDVEHINLTSNPVGYADEYGDYYSYYPDYSDSHKQGSNWDYNLVDFTIFIHPTAGAGLQSIGPGCRYFHLQPITGGVSECSGVAYAFRTGGHGGINTGWPKWVLHTGVKSARENSTEILTTNRVFIPALDSASAKRYKVRVAQPILIDARYNPFSGSTESNDDGNDHTVKVCSAFVFIPVKITLYDADGVALYHYSNKETTFGATKGHLGYSKGAWVAGADPGGDCWLEYYNPDDLQEDAGIRGWKNNRHNIGRPGRDVKLEIYDSFKKMADGEYMPYPPVAGYLEVQVLSGVYGTDIGQLVDLFDMDVVNQWDNKGIYNLLRWCLYKAPKVDVVNYNLVFDAAELEDVEYSGYINKAAKEEITIDTICGTSNMICPTAKGIYHVSSSGQQVQTLKRAGRTDHPEKLLIGTIYSQYATRKTTLTGEAVIRGGLHSYTEQNQGDKRFMLMEDVQNVRTDCTDALYCEFRPDEYDAIEEIKS